MEKYNEINNLHSDTSKNIMYVKMLLKFPWNVGTNQFFEYNNNKKSGKSFIENALNTLNTKVYGHKESKEEIKDMLCKWISNPKCSGATIGLQGPPGVGKTLLAKSLGDALNMPFVQISLSGQNDGDILYGHSFTYSSAQPGMIVKKMIESKSARCIMYFDELDKTSSKNGINEIQNILIHLTDPNTNGNFQDRFFQEITFPMNNVLFVFSYNDSSKIDPVLHDRINEIPVKPFSLQDKITIVNDHILKEICSNINLKNKIVISDDNIEFIVEQYTSEAGVRTLYRKIEKIIMKINVDKIYNHESHDDVCDIEITTEMIQTYLKDTTSNIRQIHKNDMIGIINGLYATNNGKGGIMPIQVYEYFGSSGVILKLTGNHGKIMKESIQYSYTTALNILNEKHKNMILKNNTNLHIHTPNGSIKKDGPSAGCAITVAIISCLLKKSIKSNIAVTGEIELTGNLTAIGGLIYKLHGAKQAGVNIVYIPNENIKDLKEITDEYKNLLDSNFVVTPIDNVRQLLKYIINDYDQNDFV
jgi:endopeptidase La